MKTIFRLVVIAWWFTVIAWRFVSGQHLDGKRRSDATFWTRGTAGIGEPRWFGLGEASRWALLPGWRRAAWRLGGAAVLVSLAAEPHATEWALTLAGGPLAGVALYRGWRRAALAAHRNGTVRPLAAALAVPLEMPAAELERGLSVPRVIEPGAEVVIPLPASHQGTATQHEAARRIAGQRLGHEWDSRLKRAPLRLVLARRPDLPDMVRLADVLAELDASPAGRIALGVAADGGMVYGDLRDEDPHWAVNAGSRRGKTSLLLSTAGQALRQAHGHVASLYGGIPADVTAAHVTGIDPKRVSLDALLGVPGVDIYNDPRDIPAMWAGVGRFRALLDARMEAFEHDRTIEFRRALLVLDEINHASGMWQRHWDGERTRSDPARPPVWDDIATIAYMGAQFACHIVVVGQRLDARALGGLRDSFGVRMLAGFTPQQYMFLIGQPPVPRSVKTRGRFLVYAGGELQWVQMVFGEPGEWRDYAMGHAPEGAGQMDGYGSELGAMAPGPTGHDDMRVVTGLDAAAAYLGMKRDAFRKGRQRRPITGELPPDGQGRPQWTAGALDAWRRSSPASGAAEPADRRFVLRSARG